MKNIKNIIIPIFLILSMIFASGTFVSAESSSVFKGEMVLFTDAGASNDECTVYYLRPIYRSSTESEDNAILAKDSTKITFSITGDDFNIEYPYSGKKGYVKVSRKDGASYNSARLYCYANGKPCIVGGYISVCSQNIPRSAAFKYSTVTISIGNTESNSLLIYGTADTKIPSVQFCPLYTTLSKETGAYVDGAQYTYEDLMKYTSFSSSNTDIVTIDATGNVKGIASGTAKITAVVFDDDLQSVKQLKADNADNCLFCDKLTATAIVNVTKIASSPNAGTTTSNKVITSETVSSNNVSNIGSDSSSIIDITSSSASSSVFQKENTNIVSDSTLVSTAKKELGVLEINDSKDNVSLSFGDGSIVPIVIDGKTTGELVANKDGNYFYSDDNGIMYSITPEQYEQLKVYFGKNDENNYILYLYLFTGLVIIGFFTYFAVKKAKNYKKAKMVSEKSDD